MGRRKGGRGRKAFSQFFQTLPLHLGKKAEGERFKWPSGQQREKIRGGTPEGGFWFKLSEGGG